MGIEDKIIGAAQRVAIARTIDHLELARVEAHALNAASAVILGLGHGIEQAVAPFPGEAAGVADIEMAIGAKGRAIGAAAGSGDEMFFAIGRYPGDGVRREFDDNERAIGQPDRAFGKGEAAGDLGEFWFHAERLVRPWAAVHRALL